MLLTASVAAGLGSGEVTFDGGQAGLRNRNVVAWYLIGIAAPVLGAVLVLSLPRRGHTSPATVRTARSGGA